MKTMLKEYIGFHYLSRKIPLYTFILLELNIFLNNYQTRSDIFHLLTKYLKEKIMNLLCMDIIVSFSFNISLQENPVRLF